jgi:hypothetical protein
MCAQQGLTRPGDSAMTSDCDQLPGFYGSIETPYTHQFGVTQHRCSAGQQRGGFPVHQHRVLDGEEVA